MDGGELRPGFIFFSQVSTLIHEVSTKTYVWASCKEFGEVSPIRLLKTTTAKKIHTADPEIYLSTKSLPRDFIESYGLNLKCIRKEETILISRLLHQDKWRWNFLWGISKSNPSLN